MKDVQTDSILAETISAIEAILGADLAQITVERAVIGLFFTGVKLSNGIAGACATPIKTIPEAVCCPSSAMAMPFPGKIRGRNAADLACEALSDHGIRRAVGIATLNALADCCWQRRPRPDVELRAGVDAFDATEIRKGDRVVVVGAFVPFLKELKRRGQSYLVLEQDPATLKADELPFFRPAEQAGEVVPDADPTGKVSLSYLPDPNSIAYISASRGFKPGGANPSNSSNFIFRTGKDQCLRGRLQGEFPRAAAQNIRRRILL